MQREPRSARATARANIALAKYWGKSDVALNLPAVPSVSLTLDELATETEVTFEADLDEDVLVLDGKPVTGRPQTRVRALLDRVRRLAGLELHARIRSTNRFPTGAGLASSASGFAALAAASTRAAGVELAARELSALARASSASAARSVYGGFVELPAGTRGDHSLCAEPIAAASHWDVRLVIAITAIGPKTVSSTEAMERSRTTSPYYAAWVEQAPVWAAEVKRAIASRDLAALGNAMERSTMAFHCAAITSQPGTLYWQPGTVAALHRIAALRAGGVPVWSTMDAGPHVKALCEASEAPHVAKALDELPTVRKVITASPGQGTEGTRSPPKKEAFSSI